MLSFGLENGRGFDPESLKKLIENGKKPYEFDVLILGYNAGGLACAKKLAQHGKKVALVYWRIPTPGEEESHDEDRHKMVETLAMSKGYIISKTYDILQKEQKSELMNYIKTARPISSKSSSDDKIQVSKHPKWCRKVRPTKLDLTNAIKNMYVEGLTFIHDIAKNNDTFRSQKNDVRTISWGRMMERVMDYIIRRNWDILTDFLLHKVSLYNAHPVLSDEHTAFLFKIKGGERIITAENIISAIEVHNSIPEEVVGATEYGVNLDDFFRLSTPPGKTLIVGAGPRGLECAGILTSFNFPVYVIERSSILKHGDPEIRGMIVQDLQKRGVIFLEKKTLLSIRKKRTGENLIVDIYADNMSVHSLRKKQYEHFDTILFTTREKQAVRYPNMSALEVEIKRIASDMHPCEEINPLQFSKIVTIPDRPDNVAAVELIGEHVAGHLLDTHETAPKLRLVPNIMLTPLEYAYVGLPENVSKKRFGAECIQVFSGYLRSEDILGKGSVKKDKCFYKIIIISERKLIVGLHFVGRDAVQIVQKVMGEFKENMSISQLHPALKKVLDVPVYSDDEDEEMVFEE